MLKTAVSREGAEPGTEYLAVAKAIHGKMVILGDLESSNESNMERLQASVRELVTPGGPMHLVKVTVIGRSLSLDGEFIEPSIVKSNND